jgi:xylulokinase
MKSVLAIDLGGGSVKAAVVSDAGRIAAVSAEPVTTLLLSGGGAEQDPNHWWGVAMRAAKQAILDSCENPENIAAIACASQWSVVVPVDEHINPLMNAVYWLDTRGARYNRAISGGFPEIQGYNIFKALKWIRLAGLAPTHSGVDSLGHLLFIKHERPEVYARTRAFLEPMDFLTAKLTGRITATQKTMAPFMVVENRKWGKRDYSDTLLKLAGLDRSRFPELLENNGIVGTLLPAVAHELGLLSSTPVICGIADSNASVIGSGALADFEPIIYMGTSMYLTCHVPFKKTDPRCMMTTLPSPFENRYYLLGEQGAGGKCVIYFLNHMIYGKDALSGTEGTECPDDAFARFNAAATQAPEGSSGVMFLPWLNGSLVPCEDSRMRGGFVNLSFNTTRHDLARAVMEGLAFNNRWTREAAERFLRRSLPVFRFSGGGALSDLWAEILADVLNVDIHQVEDPVHTTVRGAAMLAFLTLGYRKINELKDLVKIRRVFMPRPEHRRRYDRMYIQYRQLFKKNRKIFRALNA